MKRLLILPAALCLGFFIAANVYAWENRYSPLLPGGPFFSHVYSPLAYIRFLWRWLASYPSTFQFSAAAGLASCIIPLLLFVKSSPPKKPPAVWATVKTLKRAKLLRPKGFRLGSYQGCIVRHQTPGHLFFLASTQSGKTAGAVIPSLLDGLEDVSVIVHDPKDPGEIYEETAGYRSTFSKVIKFQPLNPTSQQYDPLQSVRLKTEYEVRDLQIIADMLGDPNGEITKGKANEGAIHFYRLSCAFNRGVLAHALYTWPGCHMEDLYEMMCGGSIEALVAQMKKAHHIDGHIHPLVDFAVNIYELTADRELSAFRNTAQQAFMLWADPLVCKATSGSDFTLEDLREGSQPLSLYLSFPFADQVRLQPLSRLMMRQCLEHAAHRKDRKGEKRYKLFALIDEFQALGHLPILRLGLNYFLGMGVTLCLITPSLNEIEDIWGTKHPFFEGTATKVAFAIRDEAVAAKMTSGMGKHEVPHTRTQKSSHGTSTSTEDREVSFFTADDLMALDDNTILAKIGKQQVLLDKTPFFLDKKLLARSKMEVRP